MRFIAYASRAVTRFDGGDLITVLMSRRRAHEQAGITGLLLYRDGRFLQIMEGPRKAVTGVYAEISADRRHSGIRLLADYAVGFRQFENWSMGYPTVSDPMLRCIPGYSDFFGVGLREKRVAALSGATRQLLDTFRECPERLDLGA